MVHQPHYLYWLPLKGRSLFALLYLLTRERVDIFFQTYLVLGYIFLQLVSNVSLNCFFVSSNRVYVVTSAPEMSASPTNVQPIGVLLLLELLLLLLLELLLLEFSSRPVQALIMITIIDNNKIFFIKGPYYTTP